MSGRWHIEGWTIVVAAFVSASIVAWGAWDADGGVAVWRRIIAMLSAVVLVAIGVFVARRLRRHRRLYDARVENQKGQP